MITSERESKEYVWCKHVSNNKHLEWFTGGVVFTVFSRNQKIRGEDQTVIWMIFFWQNLGEKCHPTWVFCWAQKCTWKWNSKKNSQQKVIKYLSTFLNNKGVLWESWSGWKMRLMRSFKCSTCWAKFVGCSLHRNAKCLLWNSNCWEEYTIAIPTRHRHDTSSRPTWSYQVWEIYWCFLKWWYPQNTPKWSVFVGKPMVVGYHHFRMVIRDPYIGIYI